MLEVEQVGYYGSDLSTYRGMNPRVTLLRIHGHEVGHDLPARHCRAGTMGTTMGTKVTFALRRLQKGDDRENSQRNDAIGATI
jgi:hypothetical protein